MKYSTLFTTQVFFDAWGREKSPSMPTPDTKKSPEKEKVISAKELHDDAALAADVEKFKKSIASGTKLSKTELDTYNVPKLGMLSTIISNIDLQLRAPNGRIVKSMMNGYTEDWDFNIQDALIKNGSNLAKLIQMYVIANDASIQYKDMATVLSGVDGNIERFSMQGLAQVVAKLKTQRDIRALGQNIDNKLISGPVKAMAMSIYTEIEKTGWKSDMLRANRLMSADVIGSNFILGSYGQRSTLDLSDWKMNYDVGVGSIPYPFSIKLWRDRDNKDAPLMIESKENRENMQNAMRLMNFVHFASSMISKESIRDTEKPFVASSSTIKINDWFLKNTKLINEKSLNAMLVDSWDNSMQDPQLVAKFLNDIFRMQNKSKPIDSGSVYTGEKKPISKERNPTKAEG